MLQSAHPSKEMVIGQALTSLSPHPTPCKLLSQHTAFHGISFFIIDVVVSKIVQHKDINRSSACSLAPLVKLLDLRRLFTVKFINNTFDSVLDF